MREPPPSTSTKADDTHEAAVAVRNLHKSYGGRKAVDGISFEVAGGEIFVLLGPNGAGKTTTVEIIEGLRHPDGGQVEVLGLDPRRRARALRPVMGVMLQEGGLYPGIKVGEALHLFAAYYPKPIEPREAAVTWGLEGSWRSPVRHLSVGQKQRLSLALALMGRPRVAFLDEPTASMDPRGRLEVWERLTSLSAEGVTIVITTHLLEEAERIGQRVGIINEGRLVLIGRPQELAPSDPVIEFSTASPIDFEEIARAIGVPSITESTPSRYRLPSPATPHLLAALTRTLADRKVLLTELSTGARSLEDIYLELTR